MTRKLTSHVICNACMPVTNLTLVSSDPEVSLRACQAFRALSMLGQDVEGARLATLFTPVALPGRSRCRNASTPPLGLMEGFLLSGPFREGRRASAAVGLCSQRENVSLITMLDLFT